MASLLAICMYTSALAMKKIFTLLSIIVFSSAVFCQTANFTYASTNGLYCTPSIIQFTQITTGNPTGFIWIFGNNNGSNLANPITKYITPGTYIVKLIVIYKKFTLTVSKTIIINPAVDPHFTIDRNKICTPGSINFSTIPNPRIASYEWNFGDNSSIVTTSSTTISHHFADFDTYPISFKATEVTGCFAQSFTTVSVERPSVTGTVSLLSGCIPATVVFNAAVGLLPASSVTSYTWKFGDGSPQVITASANTSHIYQAAGNYIPRLHIVTNEGCSNDFVFQKIAFGFPPTNHIAYPKLTVVCGSESPWFVSKANNANKYYWDFGEGDTTSTADTIIQHKFKTLGTKTVTVTPLFNDCPGTPISFNIDIIGVIAGYNYANTCSNTKHFAFTNTTQGNQSTIAWDFGDGSTVLHDINVIHTYPDTGTFNTRISITDGITGCSDSYGINIYTAEPVLVNPDSSICKNSNTTFIIPHNYNNPAAIYNWTVVGLQVGPINASSLTVNANILGHFNNNFVIINNGPQYCPDTVKLQNNILVRGPLLNFNAPAEICISKPYNIINSSYPFVPTDFINEWKWSYGINGEKDSVFQPRPYFFPIWGTYNVKLTAIDIKGCMDTLVKKVIVYDIPFLRRIPDVDTLCAGQSSTLIAFHNDPIIWSPVNSISCITCDTITVNPSITTTYYVKATSRFNCSVTDSIVVLVYNRFTAVAKKTDNYICTYESVQLEIKPGMKKISWHPSTGLSDSTIFNPIASPDHSISYIATITDSVGCFSSNARVNVFVKSLPTANAGQDKTYPFNANYTFTPLYSNNVSTYNWQPSTLLSCSNCAVPNGIATYAQTYTLTVISDSGCVARDKVAIIVECKGANLLLPTAFTPNRDNINDYYFPITRGINKIVRFTIFNRQGQLVFEAKDLLPNNKLAGWDGNFKGMPQTSAAYVYSLEAICEVGETLYKKGSFLLIR
jgi:gliding motility-associated-like protein